MTEVAANYNINMTKAPAKNMKMDAVQSPEVDAILKTLKDDKLWNSLVKCDDKNKIMLGAAPAPGVGVPAPKAIDTTDPKMIEVAMWACAQVGRQFLALLFGVAWHLGIGTLYALLIVNTDGKHLYTSGAVVFEFASTGTRILLYWVDIIKN